MAVELFIKFIIAIYIILEYISQYVDIILSNGKDFWKYLNHSLIRRLRQDELQKFWTDLIHL